MKQFFKIGLRSLAAGIPELESIIAAAVESGARVIEAKDGLRYEMEDAVFGRLYYGQPGQYTVALWYPRSFDPTVGRLDFLGKRSVDLWFNFSITGAQGFSDTREGQLIDFRQLMWFWPGDLDDLAVAGLAIKDRVLMIEHGRKPAFGQDAYDHREACVAKA